MNIYAVSCTPRNAFLSLGFFFVSHIILQCEMNILYVLCCLIYPSSLFYSTCMCTFVLIYIHSWVYTYLHAFSCTHDGHQNSVDSDKAPSLSSIGLKMQ